jgi:HTH-type transcriptional regulator / antitoxin HipB
MSTINLGDLIKSHRKIANLSQLELANLANVGKTTVFDIEKNKETVSWKNIKAVLQILNIKIHFESPIK